MVKQEIVDILIQTRDPENRKKWVTRVGWYGVRKYHEKRGKDGKIRAKENPKFDYYLNIPVVAARRTVRKKAEYDIEE